MYLVTVTLFNLQSIYSTLKIAIGSQALPSREITVTTAPTDRSDFNTAYANTITFKMFTIKANDVKNIS